METLPPSRDPIRIREDRDGVGPVVLPPQDDDLFVRTGQQVIEPCRLGIGVELWLKELRAMLDMVNKWATEHSSRVQACFCAPRGSKITLFVVPSSDSFSFDWAEEIAGLNIRAVKDFNLGMVEILQIPGDQVERFLMIQSSRQVYGCPSAAHSAMEA